MKPSAITIDDAMNSPKLFAPFFAGESWSLWRSVLKATFGEKMRDTEIAAFRAVAERDPPGQRVSQAIYIAGRGAGKDSVASLIASYIAMSFAPGKLRPGEKAVVMLLAVDRQQASIAYSYIRGLFERIPTLAAMVKSVDAESIELNNGVVIEVHTNNFRSVRGRTILAAIFDEAAFWRSEDSATPDVETAGAVQPGLARVSGSMLVVISTTHKRAGLLYTKWKEHYGKDDDDDVLVVRGTTLQFNPTFDAKIIARQIALDPQLYNAEYNSQWRDDLSSYISRELLEAAVDPGVAIRPPTKDQSYFAFADPSGGAHDSFSAAVAHREKDDTVVLDMLFEKRPPFNPSEIVEEIAASLKAYGLVKVVGDRYAAQWVVEAFSKTHITYEQSERDRSQIYLDTLPLFTAGRARLIDNGRLVSQFAQLERRTFSTGKDRVDHGRAGHDDLCNAAAGAMVLASRRAGYDSNYANWVTEPQATKDGQPAFCAPRRSLWDHPSLQFGGQNYRNRTGIYRRGGWR